MTLFYTRYSSYKSLRENYLAKHGGSMGVSLNKKKRKFSRLDPIRRSEQNIADFDQNPVKSQYSSLKLKLKFNANPPKTLT